jgi:glycosyltransferase involved in cell wall biosynthesis
MKKVLILTYYWPPSGGSGVQRWLKFTKYLRELGWEPIIYTAQNGEVAVVDDSLSKDIPPNTLVLKTPIWEPYDVYKKFMGQKKGEKMSAGMLNETKKSGFLSGVAMWVRGNFFIPDARRYWIKPSVNYLSNYLKTNPVDVIISSGPPHSMHWIARGIKQKFPQLKWVADFRDPWTNIDFYEDLKLTFIADSIHKRMEKKVLQESDAVISIGQTMQDEFKVILNEASQNKKFTVITNGFDEEDKVSNSIQKDAYFTIAHIGTLNKSRNPSILWKALSELIKEQTEFSKKMRIKLVGKVDFSVLESINEFGLKNHLIQIDYLPHNQIVTELQKSHANLLLVNQTKNAKGIITGKIFEYLLAGSPILAIGPNDGDLAHILNQTQGGSISDFNDSETLKKNILNLYKGQNTIRNEEAITKYSRKALTKELVALLNGLSM